MKYVSLALSVLTLLLACFAPAYAADRIVLDPMVENIPDWALKPAEDPSDPEEDPISPVTPTEPITVKDSEGNIIYQEDDTGTVITQDQYQVEEDVGLFLSKPFEEYTVTEGFLLLFLILGFCLVIWKIVKGVL